MQNLVANLYYVYALVLVGGGAMGSMVSKKPSSLIGSSVFGAIAVAAAVVARTNPRLGLIIGLVDTVLVTGFFIYRYMETQKAMPAFPSIGISVILAVLTVMALAGLNKGPATP